MKNPVQHRFGFVYLAPFGQCGAINHQHGQAQFARRDQLGLRSNAACILADDQVDAMLLHQRAITRDGERAAIHHQTVPRQRRRHIGRIDKAQQVVMLGMDGKSRGMHSTQGQKDAPRRSIDGGNGLIHIGDMGPLVALLRGPRGAGQGDMGDVGLFCRRDSVGAHLGGKGVGGVDQMGDARITDETDQAVNTAKSADPHRHWLGARMLRAAGIAERGLHTRVGQQSGQSACFGRAAQNEDVVHG